MTRLHDLSPEQRRVMLATADGWKRWQNDMGAGYIWTPPNQHQIDHAAFEPPDFDTDLNACATLEAKLTDEQRTKYVQELAEIVAREHDWYRPFWMVHASASQRASALLLTLCPEISL